MRGKAREFGSTSHSLARRSSRSTFGGWPGTITRSPASSMNALQASRGVSHVPDSDRALRFDFEGEYGRMYDDLVRRVIPGYEDAFVAILSLLEESLAERAALLVVGAGTGMEIGTFAPRHPSWQLTAVDPIPEMIRTTMAVAEALDVAARVTPFTGTVDLLPETPRFDAATIINVLHFLPDDGSKTELLRSVATRLE